MQHTADDVDRYLVTTSRNPVDIWGVITTKTRKGYPMKTQFTRALLIALMLCGLAAPAFAQVPPDCLQFEGTWFMRTHHDGYYEHELRIAVDASCRVVGTWRHLSTGGGQSLVDGFIFGDYVEFTRSSSEVFQSYVGRWAPTFAGGIFESVGVWYMEKQ